MAVFRRWGWAMPFRFYFKQKNRAVALWLMKEPNVRMQK